MTERVEWESFQHGPQHDCFTEHPNSPCSNERVEEIRRQVGYWIKCAAYNQPLMGVEWERSENQRWLDVADKIIEFCATALAQAERDSLCHHCGTHNARLHCQHCGRHLAFPNRPSYDDQALTLAQTERERDRLGGERDELREELCQARAEVERLKEELARKYICPACGEATIVW